MCIDSFGLHGHALIHALVPNPYSKPIIIHTKTTTFEVNNSTPKFLKSNNQIHPQHKQQQNPKLQAIPICFSFIHTQFFSPKKKMQKRLPNNPHTFIRTESLIIQKIALSTFILLDYSLPINL